VGFKKGGGKGRKSTPAKSPERSIIRKMQKTIDVPRGGKGAAKGGKKEKQGSFGQTETKTKEKCLNEQIKTQNSVIGGETTFGDEGTKRSALKQDQKLTIQMESQRRTGKKPWASKRKSGGGEGKNNNVGTNKKIKLQNKVSWV